MSIYKLKLIAVVLFICHCGYSQKSPSKIGLEVPNLKLEPILNYKQKSIQLDDIKNKVIIIDFWATWCSPCVRALSHMDSLQSKFKDDLLVFAVTSSDSYERIEKFLEKFETNLPIVVDTTQTIKKEFPHRVISHTVIIGKDRKVKAVTTPEKITEEVVQKVIRRESITLEEKRDVFGFDYNAPLPDEGLKFKFKLTGYNEAAASMVSSFSTVTGRLLFTNVSLRTVYQYARSSSSMYGKFSIFRTRYLLNGNYKSYYELEKGHKYRPVDWKKNAFCLEILAPDFTEGQIREIMLLFFHQNFELKSKIEKIKTKVKVVKRTNTPFKFKKSKEGTKKERGASGGGIAMKNVPISSIAYYLENFGIAKMPVIDETGISGNYDIKMTFREEDPDQFYKDLKEMGLEVIDAEREVEMLILYEEPKKVKSQE